MYPGAANKDPNLVPGRAVLLIVFKQPGANVIQTVDRINKALPGLEADIPPAVNITILADRTQTIRASVRDVEITLLITIILVVIVIWLFLRDVRATLIPSAIIPVCLLATCAVMLALNFSLDNLSLMAMTIAVGFVVDDAIVMEEVIWKRIEHGERPFNAALAGSREIAFTIITISISLIAVFTPLVFMGGVVGRLMQEFALTLSAAVIVSICMSLTLTPMLAGHFLRMPKPPSNWFTRGLETGFTRLERGLRPGAGRGAAAYADHPGGVPGDHGLRGVPLRHRAHRLLPAAGHRLHPGRGADLAGRFLRQDVGEDRPGRGRHHQGQGDRRRRLLPGRRRL